LLYKQKSKEIIQIAKSEKKAERKKKFLQSVSRSFEPHKKASGGNFRENHVT
jgi:hypothetical protein